MKNKDLIDKLDIIIPDPRCELNYQKDYELLIAVMLSAQCTDKRVNIVTSSLFSKYNLQEISQLDIKIIEKEIMSLGSYTKKAQYMKQIAASLINDHNGKVPNDREYLESLPGVGRKTCNVVLSELFDVPTMAVDTHVDRVSKRLGIAKEKDNVIEIEKKLAKKFPKEIHNKINHQLLLFGRYICTAKNPKCDTCLIKCKHQKNISMN